MVKEAVSAYPTLPFLWLRFGLALVVIAPFVRRAPDRRTVSLGLVLGLALATGYLLQTVGLQFTSPGNAGLITGLFVVFTPVIGRCFGDATPSRTWLAVLVALAGTGLLAGGPSGLGIGDGLVLGCAAVFALHIVLLSRWAPGLPAVPLAAVQMLACALVFTPGGLAQFRVPSGGVGLTLVVTGVLASALAFLIQTWTQRRLAAGRAALLLAMEPAWALFFAMVLTGQRLSLVQTLGAGLMVGAILGHEAPQLRLRIPKWR